MPVYPGAIQTIAFCRLSSSYGGMTGSKKHLKPLKTRELGKAKIERRLTASWRLRFSWNFAGRRPWVTDQERRWSVPQALQPCSRPLPVKKMYKLPSVGQVQPTPRSHINKPQADPARVF